MPPTAKLGGGKSQRFSPRSVAKWYWVDAAAQAGATATRLELDAGTDLTVAISAVSGFVESSNFTATPDLASHKEGKILDGVSLEDGSITFYGARDGADAASFFALGDLGHLYYLPYGDTTAEPMEQFDVEVGAVSRGKEITGASNVVAAFGLNQKVETTVPA
jgi:hypothetical protein